MVNAMGCVFLCSLSRRLQPSFLRGVAQCTHLSCFFSLSFSPFAVEIWEYGFVEFCIQ